MIPLHMHPNWQSIPEENDPPACTYDTQGNIVIHGRTEPTQLQAQETRQAEPVTGPETEPQCPAACARTGQRIRECQAVLQALAIRVIDGTSDTASEGAAQYRSGFRDARAFFMEGARALRSARAGLWGFLTQPVWVIGLRKKPKHYNRMTLFILDTVRFGGTFAVIFVTLFASLNYQSFWTIVQSHLNPIQYTASVASKTSEVNDALRNKLLRSPALAVAGGAESGDLAGFLPPVGPPENRIIIPKLNMNVPLVTPSFEALLAENWEQVEKDIQEALGLGVVHYPGTARPGRAGNFFVTGHSSYYPWAPGKYKTVFARLNDLEVGDEYWVYYGGDKHRYTVTGKKEVKPSDVTVLDQPTRRRMATLMTCTPVGTTLRRLIITADEIDPLTGTVLAVGERETKQRSNIRTEMLPI